MSEKQVAVKIEKLNKIFQVSGQDYQALKNINLEIDSKDFAIIYGPSGCGKSTLLNSIIGLEPPTSGRILVRDEDITKMSEDERAKFRMNRIGVVYQMFNWIKSLRVWENVAIPLVLSGYQFKDVKHKAIEALAEVNLQDFANANPVKLSGGQQQRVSIARALIKNPWLIVADEPTGNLDTNSAFDVMAIFQHLNSQAKRTIILVTHNIQYLAYSNRKIAMKDGQIVSESTSAIVTELENEIKGLKGAK